MRTKILLISSLWLLAFSVQAVGGTWTSVTIANLDDPMLVDGTLVKASNLGPTAAAQTIDGLDYDVDYSNIFTVGADPAVGESGLSYYTGVDPAVDNLLNTASQIYRSEGLRFGLDVKVGHDYRFQMILNGGSTLGWRGDLYGNVVELPGNYADYLYIGTTQAVDRYTYTWTATRSTISPSAYVWEAYNDLNVYAYALHSLGSGIANTPVPDANEVYVPVDLAQLSWEAPTTISPNGYRVYFGTTAPTGSAPYGMTELTSGIENILSIDPAPGGDLAHGTDYYWVVDAYAGGILYPGMRWAFTTIPYDTPPEVELTATGIITWTAELPQTLEANVNDNGEGDLTLGDATWAITGYPTLTFNPASVALTDTTTDPYNPTATFTVVNPADPNVFGDDNYTIELSVSDTVGAGRPDVLTGTDTLWIAVREDACEAKKEHWTWEWDQSAFDVDLNCIVELSDLQALAIEWLDNQNLTEVYVYPR